MQALRGLTAIAPAGEAGETDGGKHAADIALYRAERAKLWRAAEEGVALMRNLVSAYANLRKAESDLNTRRAEKQAQQAEIEETRAVLARRIEGLVAARRAQEGAAEKQEQQAGEAQEVTQE